MEEELGQETPAEAMSPPKKKSLFTKAALAKSSAAEEAVNFFSRAKELYPQRLAEEERRRQKRLVKLERKRSTASAERKEGTPSEGKRRKVSGQSAGRRRHSSESSEDHRDAEETTWPRRESTNSTPGSSKSRSGSNTHGTQASPTTLSGRYSRGLRADTKPSPKKTVTSKDCITLSESDSEDQRARPPKSASNPIVLGDDSDNDYPAIRRRAPRAQEADPDMSEEEFPELVQKYKEQMRQKELQKLKANRSFEEQNHAGAVDLDDVFQAESTESEADFPVEILITSRLEGTKPLMVKRKMGQRLQEVRQAWCDKQLLPGPLTAADLRSAIFLSWRNKRLFDYTTCKMLPLRIDGRGKLSGDGIDGEGRIHLEAWTDEAYALYQKELAAQQRKEQGLEDDEDLAEQEKQEAVKVKLILKARNLENFKLVVKPTTTVEKMVTAFRSARDVPDGKDVALYFDGERLEPDSTVEDADLGDMDAVEVHIR